MLTNIRFRLIGPSQMLNLHGLLVLSFALLIAMTSAHQFRVGGQMGWSLPTDQNAMSYNQWAEKNRFQIADSLLFVYQPDQDSVLQVDKDAYNNCNTSSFISKFDDGNTVFTFTRSGSFYFISGFDNNCKRNESLVVVVMADRSKTALGTNQSSPSPSPTR
ncbi:hypothetical protein HPP92_009185 [Vanilla planifolia]|uniref:Phytocyanin domain-containing protein n=1 Tax=Vanilla planifolia TaxID=51239 RepID=A0A835V7Y0_VANPL|nr:hypothetical protein HPP92_009388 [Vanilla planifolia]KAG0487090.1 hypothetical protein HPP92_009185 [Vanilla planifolia]